MTSPAASMTALRAMTKAAGHFFIEAAQRRSHARSAS
jgi:hypothetical protein